jgi:hypothetical protein
MRRQTYFIVAVMLVFLSSADRASGQSANFNPRDLSGLWSVTSRPGASRVIHNNRPPFTELGQQMWSRNFTSFETPLAFEGGGFDIEKMNDPVDYCDPIGYPRVMWEPQSDLMRFVQTGTVLLQMFEWHRNWRDIWLDGRRLPENPEPRYYGYATARWEGNTLVVESNGFNSRAWLDPYGSPRSEQFTMVERFTRVGPDKMEWTLVATDPLVYTRPWASEVMTLERVPKPPRSQTEELREDMCVWSDNDAYFRNTYGENRPIPSRPRQ